LVSAISVPMKYGFSIYIDFVIGLIEASPNIYKFMIQLSRQNFGEAIEEFSKTTVLFTQLYNLISKALPVLNDNLIFLTAYMPVIIKYAEPFAEVFLKTLSGMNNFTHSFIENKKTSLKKIVSKVKSAVPAPMAVPTPTMAATPTLAAVPTAVPTPTKSQSV
jgi:hypothetical protein